MVPTKTMQNTTVLDESARIKDLLLEAQARIGNTSKKLTGNLLEGGRERLGYDHVGKAAGDRKLIDVRVAVKMAVVTPRMVATILPASDNSIRVTAKSRADITSIIDHKDDRLIAVVGPCSIHDPKAALEYAEHVKEWRDQYGDKLEIVMRAYMEKPRTELGWKGFIYDPLLDESDDINLGVVATRMLSCMITDSGVPIAMERLNALTPQYVNALVAYDVIGARNTMDQKSREYASATSSPIGFKNTPEGSVTAAVQAIVSARGSHSFLGMDMDGLPMQVKSTGNPTGHVILRGDADGPNYSPEHIAATKDKLGKKDLPRSIVVDASHGNSGKKAANQMKVIEGVCEQVAGGEDAIVGVMVESNLVSGNQKLSDPSKLVYGCSITDECVDVDETAKMLDKLAAAVDKRRGA